VQPFRLQPWIRLIAQQCQQHSACLTGIWPLRTSEARRAMQRPSSAFTNPAMASTSSRMDMGCSKWPRWSPGCNARAHLATALCAGPAGERANRRRHSSHHAQPRPGPGSYNVHAERNGSGMISAGAASRCAAPWCAAHSPCFVGARSDGSCVWPGCVLCLVAVDRQHGMCSLCSITFGRTPTKSGLRIHQHAMCAGARQTL
jgi:hypothetical protein